MQSVIKYGVTRHVDDHQMNDMLPLDGYSYVGQTEKVGITFWTVDLILPISFSSGQSRERREKI